MDSFLFLSCGKEMPRNNIPLLSSSTINACNNNSFSAIVFWLLSFDGIFRLFISAYSSGNFSTRVYSLRRKSRKFRICSLLNSLTGNPSMPLIMRNQVSSLSLHHQCFFLPGPITPAFIRQHSVGTYYTWIPLHC